MSDHYSSGEREAALICWDGGCADEWNEAHPEDRISVTEWAAYQAKMDAAVEAAMDFVPAGETEDGRPLFSINGGRPETVPTREEARAAAQRLLDGDAR